MPPFAAVPPVHFVDLVVALTVQPVPPLVLVAVTSPSEPPLLHRSCCQAPISTAGFDGSTTTCGSTSLLVKLVPPMLPSSPSQAAIGLAPETWTNGPLVNGPAAARTSDYKGMSRAPRAQSSILYAANCTIHAKPPSTWRNGLFYPARRCQGHTSHRDHLCQDIPASWSMAIEFRLFPWRDDDLYGRATP